MYTPAQEPLPLSGAPVTVWSLHTPCHVSVTNQIAALISLRQAEKCKQ